MADIPFPGQPRVIIDRVLPALDGGAFPLKRVIGDRLSVTAHVFADSHDLICVRLRTRRHGQDWVEVPMQALGNDEFTAAYQPNQIGLHEYQVVGMIDHFGSWHEGFVKKAQSGQNLEVELKIGAQLLSEAAKRARRSDEGDRLSGWAQFLGDATRDYNQRLQLAFSEEMKRLATACPHEAWRTESPVYLVLFERELAARGAWYEFFPRSWGHQPGQHGTLREAERVLPEIARLGFDIVYLPPIHPVGRVFRKGKNNALQAQPDDPGSPWAIGAEEGGHKAINPALGTLDDFHHFRGAVEQLGMELALDIAFQCAPDHPYVKEHPQWFRWRPDGTVQYAENPPKKYQDILPFDFETADWQALWLELKSIFEYWLAQGVKVFRVDNPHTKSFPFWHWCILEIKKAHPEAIFLAEAFTRPKRKYRLAKTGFTQGYTYFTWRNSAVELQAYVTELTQTEVKEYFWPNFWPNTPDILHEDLQKGNRATFLGRYILAATLSSNHGIYGPAFELMEREPYPGKEEYNHNEKYQIKAWDWDRPGNLKEEIARFNRLRREHPALQRTFNIRFAHADNGALLAYVKQAFDRQDQLIIVVNMHWDLEQAGTITLPMDYLGLGYDEEFTVRDLWDPALPTYRWKGPRNFVKLDPHRAPAHIFQIVR